MKTGKLIFECTGIDEQGCFLAVNTGYGDDSSPEFVIQNLSLSAETLAVTLEDLDHPKKNFTHWVIWDIPADSVIPKAIAPGKTVSSLGGAKQGRAYGWHKYAGPKPPKNKTHRYRFTLYALDCVLGLGAGNFKKSFLKRAQGHIIQQGEITGEYLCKD